MLISSPEWLVMRICTYIRIYKRLRNVCIGVLLPAMAPGRTAHVKVKSSACDGTALHYTL